MSERDFYIPNPCLPYGATTGIKQIILTLPFPPSVNRYWRNLGRRTIISRHGREYRDKVIASVLAQNTTPTFTRPVSVSVALSSPDRRKRDLDNYFKGLFDALTCANVWEDDSLIREIYAAWQDPGNATAIVQIWAYMER